MNIAEALNRAAQLPQDKQAEILDFVEFLLARADTAATPPEHTTLDMTSPFFGMWADRPEMSDSVSYVQAMRQREWENRHAAD